VYILDHGSLVGAIFRELQAHCTLNVPYSDFGRVGALQPLQPVYFFLIVTTKRPIHVHWQ